MDTKVASLRETIKGSFPGVRPEALEADLLRALDRREIEVLFQPQFSCKNASVVGAEALARWRHPTLGEIGAKDLFAIAERAALVAPLSRHVIARALEDAQHWPDDISLSLNVTPEELGDARFATDFSDLIGESRIDPSRLTLEITEDVLLRNLKQANVALSALRALGFKIALDDFGAGFCNFKYLKELPLDILKLDHSMIEGIPDNRRDMAVFRAIVDLGHALDLIIVAEGVESDIQRAAVVAEGCDYWQGFLRAEPMPSADMLGIALEARA